MQLLAQQIEQGHAWLNRQVVRLAIDCERGPGGHRFRDRRSGSPRRRSRPQTLFASSRSRNVAWQVEANLSKSRASVINRPAENASSLRFRSRPALGF